MQRQTNRLKTPLRILFLLVIFLVNGRFTHVNAAPPPPPTPSP